MTSLAQIAIVLLAAVAFVALFRRLRLSSVLGYVAAGIAIGPHGLGWIAASEDLQHVSEFGVVLLMFVIGLELQPSRLWVLRRTVFGLGAVQLAACGALLAAGAYLYGLRGPSAAVVAFGLAMSSTAMCLQVLAERQQLKTQHGRAAFGILLFQDLAVLPVLTLVPLLAAGGGGPGAALGWGLLKLAGAVAIILVAGRLLLRPALRAVAATKVTEVFTAAALLIVVATALLVDAVGLSMSLGAFLAGVLLADSEFRHELEADIEPFKGLLLGLFFVSVGMTTDLARLAAEPLTILGLTLGFMVLKAAGLAIAARYDRMGRASAWRLALLLAGGGEFAYVLFALAGRAGLLEAGDTSRLMLAATISMALAPMLLSAYDAYSARNQPAAREPDQIEAREGDVLIVGFGRFGQIVGRILRARRIPFTALDVSETQIDFLRRFGSRIYYGDATRLDVLRAAGVGEARLLVLAIDDVDASLKAAAAIREQYPGLRVLARARNRQHAFRLMELGIDQVYRETLGSSLEMAERALESLGDPASRARATVRRFREIDAATLREQFAMRDDENKLVASAVASARQLEQLFEADREAAEGGESGSLSTHDER